MITDDNSTGLSAEELVGRIVVCDSGRTSYVVYVQAILSVTVSGPTGDHPSHQVAGLLPEGLSLHFLLSEADRLATPEDLANLGVAERLSEHLPEEILAAFQRVMEGGERGYIG
jgi:hypothetical protein